MTEENSKPTPAKRTSAKAATAKATTTKAASAESETTAAATDKPKRLTSRQKAAMDAAAMLESPVDSTPAAASSETAPAADSDSTALARLAFDALGDKLIADLVILDLRPVSLISDYFVIGSADNERQINAAIDAVVETARNTLKVKPVCVDGTAESGWVLVDFGEVMVHVFSPDRRSYYGLEEVWQNAPLVARMA